MKTTLKQSLITMSLAMTMALPVYADVEDVVEKSFSVNDDSTFTLSNINGEVEITSWQQAKIKVIATIKADDQESRDRIEVKMKQQGDQVNVATQYEKSFNYKNSNSGQVSYQVWLPASTNLSDIELVNGSLTIEGVQGEVEAELVNGSIVAKGLSQNSDISSVNGSIKAYYQSLDQNLDDIEIETVNGSIKLYLPEEVNAALDIETMHGSISTDFGLKAKKNSYVGRSLNGNIGSGGTKINLESVNGSIKVLKN